MMVPWKKAQRIAGETLWRKERGLTPTRWLAASHDIVKLRRRKRVMPDITEVLPLPLLRPRWGTSVLAQSGTLHS